jgi:hypothetical protein
MKFQFLIIALLASLYVSAQNDSTKKLIISAYGELYYSYDFSKPQNHEKAGFLYNHKRHNELNANLLLVRANYSDKNYRANLGAMAGNYAQYNLSGEPNWAQLIYEANVGIKLSKKQSLWLDAGIMPSHIGFESAVSADCWTLTRSLLAENSPYYEAGVKLGYTSKNEKLSAAAFYLNGWQRIRKPDGIQRPSFGTQVSYKPSSKITLNYSTFLGTDKPDTLKAFRHFHNFYMQYEPTNKFGIIVGFDIGSDKFDATNYGTWYSPVVIVRQSINAKTRVALRAEYYSDAKQIIIGTGTANGFQTFGMSSNLDYDINEKVKCRIEGKLYNSKDKIFGNKRDNFSLTTNITFRL